MTLRLDLIRNPNGTYPPRAADGWPIVYTTDDGRSVCASCASTDPDIHADGPADGLRLDNVWLLYEGEPECCALCAAEIRPQVEP